ncbi:MAG TPA: hypothetical protein PKN36_06790 [bacterium]|nr:hypothetical protein [bacterium]
MSRRIFAICMFCIITGFTLSSWLNAAEYTVPNGDFEQTLTLKENDSLYKRASDLNFKTESPIVLPEGWTLNLTGSAKDGEYRLVSDKDKAQSGNNFIYLRGHLMTTRNIDTNAGDEMDINFYVNNPEKSDITLFLYCYTKDENGKSSNIGSLKFSTTTEPEWTKRTGKIKIPDEINGKKLKTVRVAFTSRKGTYLDNIEIKMGKPE